LENECRILTTSNENDLIDVTKKQEELSDEQAKLVELTQIVEQKGSKKKTSFFLLQEKDHFSYIFRNG
jgi:dsDNA-binding SOS-regulon protein